MVESTFSKVLGWSYFACWSLSFYPQFILNCRRRNTEGLSVDFQWLNLLGFSCYAFYNCMLYWNNRVQMDDSIRNNGEFPDLVKINDVFFALHALLLTALTLIQIYWYGNRGSMSSPVKFSIASVSLCLFLVGFETLARNIRWDPSSSFIAHNLWTWLGFCLLVSFVKLGVTFIKYFPQALLNYRRKSTEGWSIGNVLLDLSGGVLSLAQLLVDASEKNDFSYAFDNPVKLLLGFVSIFFDLLFVFQHYYLYPNPSRYQEIAVDAENDLE